MSREVRLVICGLQNLIGKLTAGRGRGSQAKRPKARYLARRDRITQSFYVTLYGVIYAHAISLMTVRPLHSSTCPCCDMSNGASTAPGTVCTASCSASLSRSTIATRMPCPPSRRAMARPMPRAAPVTMAVRTAADMTQEFGIDPEVGQPTCGRRSRLMTKHQNTRGSHYVP